MNRDLSILEICYMLSVSRNWIHQNLSGTETREATLTETKLYYAGQKKLFNVESLLKELFKITEFYTTINYIDVLEYAADREVTLDLYNKIYIDKGKIGEKIELMKTFKESLNEAGRNLIIESDKILGKFYERKPAVRITNSEDKKFLFEKLVKPVFCIDDDEEKEIIEVKKLLTMKDMKLIFEVRNDETAYRTMYAAEYITIKINGRTYFEHYPEFFKKIKDRCQAPYLVYSGI